MSAGVYVALVVGKILMCKCAILNNVILFG